jgi:hypothetical protein
VTAPAKVYILQVCLEFDAYGNSHASEAYNSSSQALGVPEDQWPFFATPGTHHNFLTQQEQQSARQPVIPDGKPRYACLKWTYNVCDGKWEKRHKSLQSRSGDDRYDYDVHAVSHSRLLA